jgi:hypothetical protein
VHISARKLIACAQASKGKEAFADAKLEATAFARGYRGVEGEHRARATTNLDQLPRLGTNISLLD